MPPAQIPSLARDVDLHPERHPCQHADKNSIPWTPLQVTPSTIFFPYLLKRLCFEPLPETPAYSPVWHPGCII